MALPNYNVRMQNFLQKFAAPVKPCGAIPLCPSTLVALDNSQVY